MHTPDEAIEERAVLTERLRVHRQNAEYTRADLALARVPLAEAESRARRAWSRRRSAEESRRITLRAATAAGLEASQVTRLSISRFQDVVDQASIEIRAIVASAVEVCDQVDRLWSTFR